MKNAKTVIKVIVTLVSVVLWELLKDSGDPGRVLFGLFAVAIWVWENAVYVIIALYTVWLFLVVVSRLTG